MSVMDFLSIVGVLLTVFSAGYMLGKDHHTEK